MRATHRTEVCGLDAFGGKGLTNLLPITFTPYLAGLTVYVASSRSAPFFVELASGHRVAMVGR